MRNVIIHAAIKNKAASVDLIIESFLYTFK